MKTRAALLSLIVALSGASLFAATSIWTNVSTGQADWYAAGNWQASTPPVSGDSASFPSAP